MDRKEEKLRTAALERERYLSKLRGQADRRANTKELHDKAIQARTEAESISSRQYLKKIGRRSEFRAHVKLTWLEGHRRHAEMLHELGQLYKEKLTLNVGRSLEHARVRATFLAKQHVEAPSYEPGDVTKRVDDE